MTRARSWRVALVAGTGALVLALGVGVGAALESGSAESTSSTVPTPTAVDVGFSQDMIVHHEQAVVMAQMVRGRTKDPSVAALAAGIEAEQLLDIGALRGYLALWEAPILPAGPPMSWMAADHQHHAAGASVMPGMASVTELDSLRRATGDSLDTMFLQLMLSHPQGGTDMLTDAGARADLPAVRNLANRIAFHQREETQTILALLSARS